MKINYIKYVLPFIKMLIAYILPDLLKYRDIYLISERGFDARDNGYVLYRYYKEKFPTKNLKFVITKESPDFKKIDINDVIIQNSFQHYFCFSKAKILISTHVFGFSPNIELSQFLDKKNFFLYKGKKIFLQHGITKDNIEGLHYPNIKVDLFCCGAKKEYDFIKNNFLFPEGVVRYTGFPRYDLLIRNLNNESFILIMPTWRKWVNNLKNDKFVKTDFYLNYSNLLKQISLLQKNVKIIFYLHPEFYKYRNSFINFENKNIIISNPNDYNIQELLRNCRYLITDYSSVFFDVAYMNKNIIFFQFDQNKFFKNHYSKGYLNYNDFGYVCSSIEEVIERISIVDKLQFNNKYESIKKEYFTLDQNNCYRVMQAIEGVENT